MTCFRMFVGVTLAAIFFVGVQAQAADSPTHAKAIAEFHAQITDHFKAWDTNADGELSKTEVDSAIADGKNTGKTAAAIATLRQVQRGKKFTAPALTKENLAKMFNSPAAGQPDLGAMYSGNLARLEKIGKRDIFPDGLPKLDTVHQGKLGNCFCLAPLGAMVNRNPKQVVDLFVPQKDGSYCVTFGAHKVTIAPPTDAELILTSSNESAGLWVNLYEKAVGEALNQSKPAEKRDGSTLDTLTRGGSAGTMLSFITGHEIIRFSCKFAKEEKTTTEEHEAKLKELRKLLAAAQSEKRLMTCGTTKPTTPGLTPNHAYAVLGYDEKTDAIRVWNPHGGAFTPKGKFGLENGYPMKDGIFMIPVSDFVKQFAGLAFEVLKS
ncbi:C2 family cysteine protease [Zavarzinella formosa]|uniref:C2 family cysteine protease n=1 Tax=Zavarzinella formosa TaxID=360055 RepID=UPI0003021AB8|nr:C2 family cysteine protease [Zavarzinella formosa]